MVAAKNYRAPLLCYFKLCASFQNHRWIHTRVTVRKCPIWVKISYFLPCVTLKFDGWPWKTIGHLFYATASLSDNRMILLGFIWILDFHLKIVLVLRRCYLIPMRCNNSKRKMWPWRWLHHFDFQHWQWLHALMTMVALFLAGNFLHTHTHSRSPADKYAYRLYECCQVLYV